MKGFRIEEPPSLRKFKGRGSTRSRFANGGYGEVRLSESGPATVVVRRPW